MLNAKDLTESERTWIQSISSSELANFFLKYRISELRRLDSGNPDYEVGKQIQDEVAALHRLESQFRQIKERGKQDEIV